MVFVLGCCHFWRWVTKSNSYASMLAAGIRQHVYVGLCTILVFL
jgi:hypothetical protein